MIPYLFSVVSQGYVTESGNEYVILGNDALMKCNVPSFVSDLVQVHSWIDNENNEFYLKDGFNSKRLYQDMRTHKFATILKVLNVFLHLKLTFLPK